MTNSTRGTRLRLRPLREPRLLLGVLLVLAATVLGARFASAAENTDEYWVVSSAVTPGDDVSRDVLRPARIELSDEAAANYVRTDEEFDAPLGDLVWSHKLPPGALVGRESLVTRASTSRGELPLSVAEGSAPADLAKGDRVDVWVGPGPGDESDVEAVRLLTGVRILQSGDDAAAVGGSLTRTVLVEVDRARLEPVVIGTVAAGHVTLVRVP